MHSIILINQLAFIAQGHASPLTGMVDTVDKLLDRTLSELLMHHVGLDDSSLAKPGHNLAMPRTSLRSHPSHPHSLATIGASSSGWASYQPHFSSSHMQDTRAAHCPSRPIWVASPSSESHWRTPRSIVAKAMEGSEPARTHDTFQNPRPVEGDGIAVPRNVLGGELQCCCSNCHGSGIPTGFWRDGFCSTGREDIGKHTVCIEATPEFLEYSKSVGNDISTPNPEYLFPGVNPGDRWCLCLLRWVQAYKAGMAPRLHLDATHEQTLDQVDLDELMKYAVDAKSAEAEIERLDEMRAMLERAFAKPSSNLEAGK